MKNHKFHPVADIFPIMHGAEFASLVADIKANGLLEPIWLHPDGSIIDGRNRYLACQELGIEPESRTWDSAGSPVEFILSLNLHRRHLNESQRAMVAARIANIAHGGDRRSDQAADVPLETYTQSDAAQLLNVGERTVREAKTLLRESPAESASVDAGETTVTAVMRERKKKARDKKRRANKKKAAAAGSPLDVGAVFSAIVIDPPWDWGDEGDKDQLGRARPTYDTMQVEKIRDLPVGELADRDCHLYLWITNRSLPKGFDLLDAWGFRYITCLTWCKPSIGMGNYFRGSTEQVLFGVKGSQPLTRKDAGTWFSAKRGPDGHSSKPAEFYQLVESCSPGPYLEMFARGPRKGWSVWGAEA